MKEKLYKWVEKTKGDRREKATVEAYKHYLRSTDYKLSDVYGKYSTLKERAFYYVQQEMEHLNGYDLKIISYNCQMFTCGYLVDFEDETYFIRNTASHRDCIKVVE